MLRQCPSCRYDLAGLPRGTERCPECGGLVTADAALKLFRGRSDRAWILALLSPFFSLPGCFAGGIGQPILSLILVSVFAYRALRLDEMALNRSLHPVVALGSAVVFGFVWTLLCSVAMGLLAMLVMQP